MRRPNRFTNTCILRHSEFSFAQTRNFSIHVKETRKGKDIGIEVKPNTKRPLPYFLLSSVLAFGACAPVSPEQDMFCWAEENQMVIDTDKWSRPHQRINCTPVSSVLAASDVLEGGVSSDARGGNSHGPSAPGAGDSASSSSSSGGSSSASSVGSSASSGGGSASAASGGSAASSGGGGASAASAN